VFDITGILKELSCSYMKAESNKAKRTVVSISKRTHKRLKQRALDLDENVSHLADKFISKSLQQTPKVRC